MCVSVATLTCGQRVSAATTDAGHSSCPAGQNKQTFVQPAGVARAAAARSDLGFAETDKETCGDRLLPKSEVAEPSRQAEEQS